MRIAFVTLEYGSSIAGGAGTYANCLAKGLGSMGIDVHVVAPSNELTAMEERTTGVEVHHPPNIWRHTLPAVSFWLRLPGEIARLHETYKFDIVHFNGLCYWFLKRRLCDSPHVLTIHHPIKGISVVNKISFVNRVISISGENSVILPLIESRAISGIDSIICVSEYTRTEILKKYPNYNRTASVTQLGARSIWEFNSDSEKSDILQRLNLISTPYMLFVGRVDDPRKNLSFLLESLALIKEDSCLKLVIVGSGDFTRAEAKIGTLGLRDMIVYAGHVSEKDLINLYRGCIFLVSTSLMEGFGLSIVDAMAAGKPVIAPRVGAIPEIVREMENGIIYESGDSRGLSDAIFRLWNDTELARSMGERNAEKARSSNSWMRVAEETVKHYRSLL